MTLIDHFNAFQTCCECRNFTANARSLYYAILSEFNKRRFPEELKLSNCYLQEASGITARSSFDAARNVLISTNVIKHKHGTYSLVEPIKIFNDCGYTWEYPKAVANEKTVATPESVPASKETPVTTADDWRVYAKNFLSPEVLEAWSNGKGEALEGYKILDMRNLEKLHGTKKILAAIEDASLSCNYDDFHKLTYKLFKMKLNNPQNLKPRGNKNAYNTRNNVTARNVRSAEDWTIRTDYFDD